MPLPCYGGLRYVGSRPREAAEGGTCVPPRREDPRYLYHPLSSLPIYLVASPPKGGGASGPLRHGTEIHLYRPSSATSLADSPHSEVLPCL